MDDIELKKLKSKIARDEKVLAFRDDKNPKPPFVMWKEFLDVSDKLEAIKGCLEEREDVKEYYDEIENIISAIGELKDVLEGKEMSVNIPLDNLSSAIKNVEVAIKNIPKTVIPEPVSYNEKLDVIASKIEKIEIPKFPINELEAMLMAIGKRLDKMTFPDYEDNFDELVKAVKNIKQGNTSITTNGFKNVGIENASGAKINPATAENQTAVMEVNSHTLKQELRVFGENHICADNTTTALLLANATFTGGWQDCLNYQEVNVSIISDQNSATNGLVFQWSADASTIGDIDAFSYYAASGGTPYTPNPAFRYFRIVYTNGTTNQTTFSLQSILRRSMTGGSFHRIDSTLKDDADARLGITIPKLKTAANTYVSQTATTAGNAKISLEELETGVSDNNKTQLKTSMYGKTGDATFQVPRIDAITHSLQIIDYEHHEIHSGSHFFVDGVQDLSINQVLDFTWQMPNTTKWTHWTWQIETESETAWYVYETVVATNPLANTVTPLNNDRNSATTSGTTMKFELQSNLTAANNDTDVTGATLLQSGISGAGKTSGDSRREHELILKQNTLYCLRAVASSAGYIDFKMNWYEHTNKTA